MAEWFKAHAWKACLPSRVTRVRIPFLLPYQIKKKLSRTIFSIQTQMYKYLYILLATQHTTFNTFMKIKLLT